MGANQEDPSGTGILTPALVIEELESEHDDDKGLHQHRGGKAAELAAHSLRWGTNVLEWQDVLVSDDSGLQQECEAKDGGSVSSS